MKKQLGIGNNKAVIQKQVKEIWAVVNNKADWDILTASAKWEIVRVFIKYSLIRWFR